MFLGDIEAPKQSFHRVFVIISVEVFMKEVSIRNSVRSKSLSFDSKIQSFSMNFLLQTAVSGIFYDEVLQLSKVESESKQKISVNQFES